MSHHAFVELSDVELDAVHGGTYDCCYCCCPPNPPLHQGGANPGNNMAVGNASEYPPGQGPGGTGDRGNSR